MTETSESFVVGSLSVRCPLLTMQAEMRSVACGNMACWVGISLLDNRAVRCCARRFLCSFALSGQLHN